MQARAKFAQRCEWIKASRISAHAEMNLFSIMDEPAEITRSQTRIEKAMKSWRPFERHAGEHLFNPDNPFAIDIETERAADSRSRSVRADQISGPHPTRR